MVAADIFVGYGGAVAYSLYFGQSPFAQGGKRQNFKYNRHSDKRRYFRPAFGFFNLFNNRYAVKQSGIIKYCYITAFPLGRAKCLKVRY